MLYVWTRNYDLLVLTWLIRQSSSARSTRTRLPELSPRYRPLILKVLLGTVRVVYHDLREARQELCLLEGQLVVLLKSGRNAISYRAISQAELELRVTRQSM